MAVFPTITQYQAVEITTNSSALSYQQLLTSLNNTFFEIYRLYIEASNNNQASTQFQFQMLTSDGQLQKFNFSGTIDPNQFQSILDLKNKDGRPLILDAMTTIWFTLKAASTIDLYFFSNAVSYNDLIETDWASCAEKETIQTDDCNCQLCDILLVASIAGVIACISVNILNKISK